MKFWFIISLPPAENFTQLRVGQGSHFRWEGYVLIFYGVSHDNLWLRLHAKLTFWLLHFSLPPLSSNLRFNKGHATHVTSPPLTS